MRRLAILAFALFLAACGARNPPRSTPEIPPPPRGVDITTYERGGCLYREIGEGTFAVRQVRITCETLTSTTVYYVNVETGEVTRIRYQPPAPTD